MKRPWILAVAPILVVLAVACSDRTGSQTPVEGDVRVGEAAPGFTLPRAGGGSVSLSDYRGERAVLLYFSMGPG